VLIACLLFGFLEAAANRMQGTELPLVGELPVEFILILPYAATVVLLVGFFGKAIPPKALGTPYVKER
jgi:simple sugar transport system permease protein